MSTSAIVQSPDGNYSVEKQEDFGEIGMGHPASRHITLRGADVQFADFLFGESIIFSSDARFVAFEQWSVGGAAEQLCWDAPPRPPEKKGLFRLWE